MHTANPLTHRIPPTYDQTRTVPPTYSLNYSKAERILQSPAIQLTTIPTIKQTSRQRCRLPQPTLQLQLLLTIVLLTGETLPTSDLTTYLLLYLQLQHTGGSSSTYNPKTSLQILLLCTYSIFSLSAQLYIHLPIPHFSPHPAAHLQSFYGSNLTTIRPLAPLGYSSLLFYPLCRPKGGTEGLTEGKFRAGGRAGPSLVMVRCRGEPAILWHPPLTSEADQRGGLLP